jgi:S-adenosylmethionine uptake transporter
MISSFMKIDWFFRPGFPQGAFWAILVVFFSSLCDVLMRCLGENIHFTEIIFFRFFFGFLTIIPLILSQGIKDLRTTRINFHILRAVLGVTAFFADCYAVKIMPLNEYTILVSCQPLFFLPLAFFFLGEKVIRTQLWATLIGFLGVVWIQQAAPDILKIAVFIPICGAFLFSLLDLFTKKMTDTESTYSLLFYFSFGTTILALFPTLFFWQTPTFVEFGLLILLGIGANLIQYCLIKSFMATNASLLMPFRYVYFLFSILFGYMFFSEIPTPTTLSGAFFIILGTFFISKRQRNR